MITAAAPLAAIALTSLLVQGRHIFYALSFPLHQVSGRLRRIYAMFALVDEAYALTAARPADELTSTRILAMQVLMHASWVGGGIAGALAGTSLPAHVPALGFVFTALFVVLAVEGSLVGRRLADLGLALACALAARVVAPGQMLLLAMGRHRRHPRLETAHAPQHGHRHPDLRPHARPHQLAAQPDTLASAQDEPQPMISEAVRRSASSSVGRRKRCSAWAGVTATSSRCGLPLMRSAVVPGRRCQAL
jgi:AzlC protein